MTKDEFSTGMRRLRAAMSKTKIPPEESAILYSELSFIPSPAWPDVVSLAIQRWDGWPRNFIKECKELWRSWLSSHPESQTKHDTSTCYQCWASTGFIWAFAPTSDTIPYRPSVVFRCGHCDNAEACTGIPRKTRDQITDDGYHNDDTGRYRPGDETITPIKRSPPPIILKTVPSRRLQ